MLDKANAAGKPVFGSEIEQVKLGCVAAEGLDYIALGRQTGLMAAKVLKGEAKASEIPYEIITEPGLYVNARVMKQFGVKLPDELAARAKAAGQCRSQIWVDVKPWDDTTDMKKMEEGVRKIELDGLVWGPSKLVEVGFGIKKLSISCVVIDDLVCTDDIEEAISALDEYVQSVDIGAMNKV